MSQKRMGPAPFASFEDLSDEVESPTAPRLPEIKECRVEERQATTSAGTSVASASSAVSCLQTPSTPRIDISRASSSSHHEEDSRDSTPERELFEPQCARLGLAFREDGAMDLRSSTEELDFQDPDCVPPQRSRHTSGSDKHCDRASDPGPHVRKDSQGSELGFLSVSGRTSRLSSIGSQGSRASNQSQISGISRSPSPHKMLVETSFCGTKASATSVVQPPGGAALEPDLEQALLSRKHDPTQAVLAEGISIELRKKIQPVSSASPKRKPPAAIPIVVEPDVHVDVDVVQHPMSPGKTIVADSGVEYTFIPLKGPLPPDMLNKNKPLKPTITRKAIDKKPVTKTSATKGNAQVKTTHQPVQKTKSAEPEYIRIKLKPDHMYTDNESPCTNTQTITTANIQSPETSMSKPISLNLKNGTTISPVSKPVPPPGGSPKLSRLRDGHSRTPSPSVSRKSSFTSLFRSKEAIISSPESPGETRARSKSKERDHKSMFGIFKPKKSCIKKQSSPEAPRPTQSPLPLEFKFNATKPSKEKLLYYETPLEGDSIRIPLHSPGTEPEPLELFPPTPPAATPQETAPQPVNPRHSSTSSETMIFTTNLGSNNEIFTTKLPKDKRITENHCEKPIDKRHSVEVEREESKEKINSVPVKSEPPLEAPTTLAMREDEPSKFTRSESSESERDLDRHLETGKPVEIEATDEHELKTLVHQLDEDDDELPFIPTTLPLERSVAVPIVPIKQRGEVRTCSIERPRSTTPINPSSLEEYCEDIMTTAEPKLRISLPRDDTPPRGARPRKWEFERPTTSGLSSSPPPPLPPRGAPKDWINFEEVPERRKAPKRIQVLPSAREPTQEEIIYSYVNPEDCKCECHEQTPRQERKDDQTRTPDAFPHQKLPS